MEHTVLSRPSPRPSPRLREKEKGTSMTVESVSEDTMIGVAGTVDRSRVLKSFSAGDALFRTVTFLSALTVLVLLGAVFVSLVIGAHEALATFGFSFFTTQAWNPVTEKFGALAPISGTLITSVSTKSACSQVRSSRLPSVSRMRA